VRRLWEGKEYETPNGKGEPMKVTIHPLPLQKRLNVWLTCSGGKERFAEAGAKGYNVLTALLFQQVEDLAEKVASYREARAANGHAGPGRVTLMLHTFVGADEKQVKEAVRQPFKDYLESSSDLWQAGDARLKDLSPRKKADMLEYAFERYYQKTALLGAQESCAKMVESVARVGVDEIACLIDFGLKRDVILRGLEDLDVLRRRR